MGAQTGTAGHDWQAAVHSGTDEGDWSANAGKNAATDCGNASVATVDNLAREKQSASRRDLRVPHGENPFCTQILLQAPDARRVTLTHCVARNHGADVIFVMDEGTAGAVKYSAVGSAIRRNQYHHVGRNSGCRLRVLGAQIRVAAGCGPRHLETAYSDHRRCGCNHPSHETSAASRAAVQIFFEPPLHAVTEPQRHVEHALITI